MTTNVSNWRYPVGFYFLVDFQNLNGVKFQASFFEVDGIGWTVNTDKKNTNSNGALNMPTNMTYDNITFKCPVSPLSDDFSKWVNDCANTMSELGGGGKILRNITCDVIIKLLDESGQPLSAWACNHAYPVSYKLGTLNAAKSDLAMETITLAYNHLERIV